MPTSCTDGSPGRQRSSRGTPPGSTRNPPRAFAWPTAAVGLAVLVGLAACDPAPDLRSRCDAPRPLVADGDPTGFALCADGSINRVASRDVVPVVQGEPCRGDEENLTCTSDADCAAPTTTNRCIHVDPHPLPPTDLVSRPACACVYACASDAECGVGAVCVPPVVSGYARPACVPALCQTGADCATGECGLARRQTGCGALVSLACREPDATCRTGADCDEHQSCAPGDDRFEVLGGWRCLDRSCEI